MKERAVIYALNGGRFHSVEWSCVPAGSGESGARHEAKRLAIGGQPGLVAC